MKHYHDYKCDVCTLKNLPEHLGYISKSGYKLISVTEKTAQGYSSYYTLFYDRRPEEEK